MYGQYLAAFFIFTTIIVVSIVTPLTVESPLQPAPIGFNTGKPETYLLKKKCPTTKTWNLATNERDLSNQYFKQLQSVPDPRSLNSLAWAWGQFIDHDIVLTKTDPDTIFQIELLNVTRTLKDSMSEETITYISTAIDASTVYGDYRNPTHLALLRIPGSCLMKTTNGPDGPLLPLDPGVGDGGFISGDVRSDEHSLLTSLHTIWVREHNRLCGILPSGGKWSENARFWTARRAVIGQINHITFHEWLPALFGSQAHLLSFTENSEKHITDVFGGAAYRFGHSMVGSTLGDIPLLDLFFDPTKIQQNGIAYYLDLASKTASEKVDVKVVDGLRNIMFGHEDLITRNLFRGREMGLPTYREIAQCYGFDAQNNFEDPLLGLLSEPLVDGSSLPRGIAIILAEQFNRLRNPDTECPYYLLRSCSFNSVIEKNTGLKGINFFLPK